MFRKMILIVGVFIIGTSSFHILNKSLEDDEALAKKGEQSPLFTEEEKQRIATLEKVTEKLHPQYHSFVVSSNSDKEIVIQVLENEDYFNSVKKEMELITENEIKSSPLEKYTVIVKRIDQSLFSESEEDRNSHNELVLLMQSLREGLKDYGIGDIDTDQEFISIHTTIKDSDKEVQKLAMEIEEKAKTISKELNSAFIDSYKIKIVNSKGEVLN